MGDDYRAVVQKIVSNGKHGPFAVAGSEELGSVTFSLSATVWKGEQWPETGTYVVLSQVMKKRAGWRANHGRLLKPSDEKKQRG